MYDEIIASKRLLLLDQLKRNFVIQQMEEKNVIHTNVEGKGFLATVEVVLDVYEGEYVRIKEYKILNSTNNIGPKREVELQDELKRQFLKEHYLMKKVELPYGYLFGEHNFYSNSYHGNNSIVFVQKVRTKKLELLLTDWKKKYNQDKYQREFFYYNNNLYIRENDKWNSDKEQAIQTEGLEGIINGIFSSNAALDENGRIYYTVIPVNDPSSIRLLDHSTSIQTKETFHSDYSGYGIGETITEKMEIHEELQGKWTKNHLPIQDGEVTVYSDRIFGKSTPDLIGEWIKVLKTNDRGRYGNEGYFGKVLSQNGPRLTVQLENHIPFVSEMYHISQVDVVSDPTIKPETYKPVLFTIDAHDKIRGFGFIQEEYPNVVKVFKIFKFEDISSDLMRWFYGQSHYSYRQLKELLNEHDIVIDYVLINKEDIIDIPFEKEILPIISRYDTIQEELDYQILFNVICLSKVKKTNQVFFSLYLYLLGTKIGFSKLFLELTERIKQDQSYYEITNFKEEDMYHWMLEKLKEEIS